MRKVEARTCEGVRGACEGVRGACEGVRGACEEVHPRGHGRG